MTAYKINITEFLDENIKLFSDRTAVVENENSITFGELFEKVKVISKAISQAVEGRTNQIIGVLLPKSINSVVADFAILYSGNAYMNLDVNNPKERLLAIISQVKPTLIITLSKYQFTDVLVDRLWFDCFEQNISFSENGLGKNIRSELIDTDPCCVINTSGSTGVPKSVILNHRSFIDFIEAVRETGFISNSEIIGSLSPIIFDIYSFELCMMMVWGSSLVIIPDSYAAFPAKMLQYIKDKNVSYLFWVPTIMVNIANMDLLSKIPMQSLRMIWFAGEVFPTVKFNYWKRNLPQCRFVNFYGPIEITLDCLFHEVKEILKDEEPIPIGKPFRNTSVLLLDEDNNVVKDGVEGELCIRGSSLAMGYFNNPEKTHLAFVQNPLNNKYPELIYKTGDIAVLDTNGNYIFKGRKDSLVKRMGYRIELSEIEHVIVDSLKLFKNCCVFYQSQTKDIVLIYESDKELPVRDIQKSLMTILPKYMIPTKTFCLERMPRNPNGKIDRNLLKNQFLELLK